MTTNYGPVDEYQQPQPYKQPLGKISMWFGIATTPILATSALLLTAHGYQIIAAAILQLFVLIVVAGFALVSMILGGLAVQAKHQQQHAYIGIGLAVLSAAVGIGSLYIH